MSNDPTKSPTATLLREDPGADSLIEEKDRTIALLQQRIEMLQGTIDQLNNERDYRSPGW